MVLTGSGAASALVADALQLPRHFIADLIRFGAVYYSPIVPMPGERTAAKYGPDQMARLAEVRRFPADPKRKAVSWPQAERFPDPKLNVS